MGENTNNVAELISLVRGLQDVVQHHYHQIIIEEDSQIIIQLISKILHGELPKRISPSWRLSGLLEDLENTRIDTKSELIYWQAHLFEDTNLSRHCKDLANRDSSASDGVTRGNDLPPGSALGHSINADGHHPSSLHLRW